MFPFRLASSAMIASAHERIARPEDISDNLGCLAIMVQNNEDTFPNSDLFQNK